MRRLPQRLPIAVDRSRCDSCGHDLAPRDLIPILSYSALRGRCRFCDAPIGRFHLWVELAAVSVAAVAIASNADPAALWYSCVLGWVLLALAWIDWRHMILPDILTLPLVLLGFVATYWLAPDAMLDHALAAVFGYLAPRTIAVVYRRLRGRDGLGEGDAKLMAAAGAWVGLFALSWVLAGGALLTLCAAVIRAWHKHETIDATTRLPLGTGLCVALWLVWLQLNSALVF